MQRAHLLIGIIAVRILIISITVVLSIACLKYFVVKKVVQKVVLEDCGKLCVIVIRIIEILRG